MLGHAAWLSLAAYTAWRAWSKAGASEPEWCHWATAATTPDVSGLQYLRNGYSPGVVLLLRPLFALPREAGALLLIAVNLLSAGALLMLLWRGVHEESGRAGKARPGPWQVLWLAAPFHLAIQNNQLVTPMLLLTVVGFLAYRRGRTAAGGLLLAVASVVKILPLALVPLLLIKRRLGLTAVFCAAMLVLSVCAASAVYGFDTSVELHVDWPRGVLDESPSRAIGPAADAPFSFGNNQSAAAWIARGQDRLGAELSHALAQLTLWGTLAVAAAVVLRRRGAELDWHDLALWLSWIAFASPFGRYYYSLLLVPAWTSLAAAPGTGRIGRLTRAAALALPIATWGSRSSGWFAVIAGLTFALVIARSLRSSDAEPPEGRVEVKEPRPGPRRT